MKYDYHDSIREDIRAYIAENITIADYTREELEEHLNEVLWAEDSVTGNASGSYTFSRWAAEEYLCHNFDLLIDAMAEFGGSVDVLEDPESADVTIRCFLLGECIADVLDSIDELE